MGGGGDGGDQKRRGSQRGAIDDDQKQKQRGNEHIMEEAVRGKGCEEGEKEGARLELEQKKANELIRDDCCVALIQWRGDSPAVMGGKRRDGS